MFNSIIEESYKLQISSQQLAYSIMVESYSSLITEANNDGTKKSICQRIKAIVNKVAKTLRDWFSKLVKFLTVTIPEFVKGVFAKVVEFVKKKKKVKNIKTPKNATAEDKEKVKDIAKDINTVNNAKASAALLEVDDTIKNNIEEKVDVVKQKVELLPDLYVETKKDLNEAIETEAIVVVDNKEKEKVEQVKCVKIKEDVIKSLNALADAANASIEIIKGLSEGFKSIDSDLIKFQNPAIIINQVKPMYEEIKNFSFKKQKNTLIYEKKFINPQEAIRKSLVWVDVKEIQSDMQEFMNNKNAEKIKKAASIEIDELLSALNEMDKQYKDTSYAAAGAELTNMLTDICNIFMQYYSDLSTDYGKYVAYAIKYYTKALTGIYNNR